MAQQANEVRRTLNQEIMNIAREIESRYSTARAREEGLERETGKQQSAALSLKEIGVEYAVLQEEVNVNRALYESVLKRLNETRMSNDIPVSNIMVAQMAEMPRSPSLPRTDINLLLAGAFGIILGVGTVFCLEYFDSSVGTPEAVWRIAAKPTLGVVPKLASLSTPKCTGQRLLEGLSRSLPISRWLPAINSNSRVPVISQHPASIVADSFRTIRTALLLSRAEKPPQVILLTSASPGEGKTVTTLNLAIALAQGGKSVLVIDADLRRGRCHELVGLANNRGLTEVLASNESWQERIQVSKVGGLSLLSRGAVPPYPPDLLASSKMGEVLNAMRQAYDFVLIDSPPVIPVTDAIVVSGYCDGTVLVVHAQNSTAESTRQAMDRLQVVHSSVLGVVLNSIRLLL
jgi:capsular exopolysaccharide synthesis family protein